jgi:hypothetical protein
MDKNKSESADVHDEPPKAPEPNAIADLTASELVLQLQWLQRDVTAKSTTRAEYDHCLRAVEEALKWAILALNADPTIHKDANIPPGT